MRLSWRLIRRQELQSWQSGSVALTYTGATTTVYSREALIPLTVNEHVFVLPLGTAFTAAGALKPLCPICTNEHGGCPHASFVRIM